MNPHSVIRSAKLPDQVYEVLARRISTGDIKIGERLPPENQLADEFGVSRTVLREAIARLRNAGLVVTKQGLGMFVAQSLDAVPFRINAQTRTEIIELFELRLGVETQAAALAAQRRTDAQLHALQQAIQAMQDAMQVGRDSTREDFQFHHALADATGNNMYRNFLAFLAPHLQRHLTTIRKYSQASGHTVFGIIQEHQAIYDAVLHGDPQAARDAAHHHLHNGIQRLTH